jgi:hypothetical protein
VLQRPAAVNGDDGAGDEAGARGRQEHDHRRLQQVYERISESACSLLLRPMVCKVGMTIEACSDLGDRDTRTAGSPEAHLLLGGREALERVQLGDHRLHLLQRFLQESKAATLTACTLMSGSVCAVRYPPVEHGRAEKATPTHAQ